MLKIEKLKDYTFSLFGLSIVTCTIAKYFDYKILHIIDNLVFISSIIMFFVYIGFKIKNSENGY